MGRPVARAMAVFVCVMLESGKVLFWRAQLIEEGIRYRLIPWIYRNQPSSFIIMCENRLAQPTIIAIEHRILIFSFVAILALASLASILVCI